MFGYFDFNSQTCIYIDAVYIVEMTDICASFILLEVFDVQI